MYKMRAALVMAVALSLTAATATFAKAKHADANHKKMACCASDSCCKKSAAGKGEESCSCKATGKCDKNENQKEPNKTSSGPSTNPFEFAGLLDRLHYGDWVSPSLITEPHVFVRPSM